MNPFGIPEYAPSEVAEKRTQNAPFLLVDVREANELELANLGEGIIHMPLSELADKRLEAVPAELSQDKDQEIVVFCHHGSRSAQVCAFLRASGWTNVINMEGGIHLYAVSVDSSVGMY